MCGKPGKGRHGTSHHACLSHISNIKSFLPVEAEISVTKVWTDGRTDGQGDYMIFRSLKFSWYTVFTRKSTDLEINQISSINSLVFY